MTRSTTPPILEHLAGKVRARRKALSITLRELGEVAGVSERFLVLLEGGRANISVAKLDTIARALGTSASALLAGEEGDVVKATHARVALLGLRGAGKTTIGKEAAARVGLPFIELDERVSARAGSTLGELFELHGASYYRRLEREEVDRLIDKNEGGVIAAGGGIVADHATFELLRRSATTIWLKAKAEDHWSRVVAQGDARPMANRSGAMNELRALLRARRPLYERADHVVDTSALGLLRSIERVVKITRAAIERPANAESRPTSTA